MLMIRCDIRLGYKQVLKQATSRGSVEGGSSDQRTHRGFGAISDHPDTVHETLACERGLLEAFLFIELIPLDMSIGVFQTAFEFGELLLEILDLLKQLGLLFLPSLQL